MRLEPVFVASHIGDDGVVGFVVVEAAIVVAKGQSWWCW
jgi:hypothetical protein